MKKYRILPLLLIVCLLLTAAFPAAAAKNTADNSADTPQSTANVSSDGVPQSTVQAQEGSYVFGSDAVKSALDEKLQANCVLLADEDSGQYYYTRNIDAKAYPASLTKIMTLLLAVEAVERGDVNLSDTVTAYDDCNADMVEGASNADIKVGETMTFEDFLYCAMISSANEACNVVAEYVCGSISAFVQRMNERAQALGCTGTHFANPHGLPNDDHYTTAHDLYRITKEALSHELFATICNTVKHTVPATNLSDERTLSNTNGLINPESPMYRGWLLLRIRQGRQDWPHRCRGLLPHLHGGEGRRAPAVRRARRQGHDPRQRHDRFRQLFRHAHGLPLGVCQLRLARYRQRERPHLRSSRALWARQ